jgi:hypothetical protein
MRSRTLSAVSVAVIGLTLVCTATPSQAFEINYTTKKTIQNGVERTFQIGSKSIVRDFAIVGTTVNGWWLAWWYAKPKDNKPSSNQMEPLPAPAAVP